MVHGHFLFQPFLWNKLTFSIKNTVSVETFKSKLKTFLFKEIFY